MIHRKSSTHASGLYPHVLAGVALLSASVACGATDLELSSAVANRYVYRGIEKFDENWQVALHGVHDGWEGQIWAAGTMKSGVSGEVQSTLGYSWKLTPVMRLQLAGTHFWYLDSPQAGATAHSFEGSLRLFYEGSSGWEASTEATFDVRRQADIIQGSLSYALPLQRLGTSLKAKVSLYSGLVFAEDLLPDSIRQSVSDSYDYFGAKLISVLPVSSHFQLSAQIAVDSSRGQNPIWLWSAKQRSSYVTLQLGSIYSF